MKKRTRVLGFTALVGDTEKYLAENERATCARCGNKCERRATVSLMQLGMFEDVTTVCFKCKPCLELTAITYKTVFESNEVAE